MVFLGYKLKELRKLKKLSLSEVEKLTGVNSATISAIENDRVKQPRRPTVQQISRGLNVHEIYFYIEDISIPLDILPDMPTSLLEFVINEENVPWLKLAQHAKWSGISVEVLENFIQFLCKGSKKQKN